MAKRSHPGFPHPKKPDTALMPRRVFWGHCEEKCGSDPNKAKIVDRVVSLAND